MRCHLGKRGAGGVARGADTLVREGPILGRGWCRLGKRGAIFQGGLPFRQECGCHFPTGGATLVRQGSFLARGAAILVSRGHLDKAVPFLQEGQTFLHGGLPFRQGGFLFGQGGAVLLQW